MDKQVWEYISTHSGEKIYTWKTCIYSGEDFPVFEKEKTMLDDLGLPLPRISPDERLRNMYMTRNERKLYKRDCDLTGKPMLSVYPPQYSGKVYDFKQYSGSDWSAFDYAIDIDLSKDLREQISYFFTNIPQRSLNIIAGKDMENCDYSNYGFASKNCYMCQVPAMAEDCYYSYLPFQSTYNVDTYLNEQCEISYESMMCINSYNIFYCQHVENSRDCWFGYDLIGCSNCLGCVGLSEKQYYILNQAVTSQEYQNKLLEITHSHKALKEFESQYHQLQNTTPQKSLHNKIGENIYGDSVRYSSNIINSYGIVDIQDSMHSNYIGMGSSHLYSCSTGGSNSSHVYYSIGFRETTKSAYLSFANGNRSYYLYDCDNCDDCMFCSGLKNQRYCIFNVQYTKQEYELLLAKLIHILKSQGLWGTEFPTEMILFPYNDSKAYYEFPVEKVIYLDQEGGIIKTENIDAKGKGIVYVLDSDTYISKAYLSLGGNQQIDITWRTQEDNVDITSQSTIISAHEIDEIQKIDKDILDAVILCEDTQRPYKIIAQELDFYKKYSLAIPRKHPDTRFKNRLKKLTANTLFLRSCVKCKKDSLSSWERNDIVCETCFDKNRG